MSTSNSDEYKLVRKVDGSLVEGKKVFFQAFHLQYKKYDPIKDLGLKPLESPSGDIEKDNYFILDKFLELSFDEETTRFQEMLQNGAKSGDISEYFFQVETNDNEVVGYASMQHDEMKKKCYIHQLGVKPNHWGRGIGRQLVFALENSNICNDLSSVCVLTRRINQEGIDFYKRIGFEEVTLDATGDSFLDFTKYIQLEWKG